MSKGLLKLGVLGLSALTFTLASTGADAQERVRWKMQSAFASTLPHLGPSGVRFSKDIERMSGGKFEVKFFEPGALIPPLECFDAVSKGSIEACWTTPGYHTGKYPALAFFTTVPFGPGFGEFLAWKWFGGGNKLRDEIYAKHGLVAVDCFCIGPETSGWFRKEIKSVDELKGLKMRFFGLGAQVMQKLGVSTQLLAGGRHLSGARARRHRRHRVLDAQDGHQSRLPSGRQVQLLPGLAPAGLVQRVPDEQEGVSTPCPTHYKAMIEVAGQAQVAVTYAETEAQQFEVMAEMRDKHKVQVKRWDDKALAAFEKAWLEVLAEESAKDPLFKKVADHYLDFRKKYAIWGELAGDEAELRQATERTAGAAPCCAGPFKISRSANVTVKQRHISAAAPAPHSTWCEASD